MSEWPGRIWDDRWWGWSGCNFPPGNAGSTFQISSAFLEKNVHFSWYFKLSFCSKHKTHKYDTGLPTKDGTPETTVRNLLSLVSYITGFKLLLTCVFLCQIIIIRHQEIIFKAENHISRVPGRIYCLILCG